MKGTILVIASCVLLSFPFLGIFSAWKDWIAFGIGIVILVMIGHRRLTMEHDATEEEHPAPSGKETPASKEQPSASKGQSSASKNNSPTSKNNPPTSAVGE